MFVRIKMVKSTWKPQYVYFGKDEPRTDEAIKRKSAEMVAARESFHFALMESKRVDGKPRQKVIKHLGSIKRNEISTGRIVGLWNCVGWNLDKLKLTDDQRQKIVDAIAKALNVPAPCQEAGARKDADEKRRSESAAIMQGIKKGVVTRK